MQHREVTLTMAEVQRYETIRAAVEGRLTGEDAAKDGVFCQEMTCGTFLPVGASEEKPLVNQPPNNSLSNGRRRKRKQ